MKSRNWIMGASIGVIVVVAVLGGIRISQGQMLVLADSPAAVQTSAVNGHIVYFADNRVDPDSPLASRNVAEQLGAQQAETWADVLDAQAEAPIDVLMIHSVVQDKVDRQWVREAYNNGMLVVLVDSSYPAAAEFLNNPCLSSAPARDTNGPLVVAAYRITVGYNPEDVQLVKNAYLAGQCEEGAYEGATSYVGSRGGAFSIHVQGNGGLASIAEGLNLYLADRAEYLRLYESGELQQIPQVDDPPGGN